MRYYVIADDGQKYGPADVPTLNQWAQEGRLLPTSMLEDEASGARVAASTVTGIGFPGAQGAPGAPGQPANPYASTGYSAPGYSPGPYGGPGGNLPQTGYTRPGAVMGDDGSKDVTQAWLFGVLGLFCCGIVLGFLGLNAAKRAEDKGHPGAKAAKIMNYVTLGLWAVGLVFRMVGFATGMR
jgi:hypothetical protein